MRTRKKHEPKLRRALFRMAWTVLAVTLVAAVAILVHRMRREDLERTRIEVSKPLSIAWEIVRDPQIDFVAEPPRPPAEDTYLWVSNNSSFTELPEAIASLFVTLRNAGQLPTRVVRDAMGRTAEEVLRDEGLLLGPHIPVALDSLMCDLNPHICSRPRAASASLRDPSAHVLGHRFSRGRWSNSKGSSFVVPAMELYEYETFERYYKEAGEAVSSILEARGVKCGSFPVSCEEAVRILNDEAALMTRYEGWLVLPTRSVKAKIALGAERPTTRKDPLSGPTEISVEQTAVWPEADRASLVESLGEHIVTKGEAQFEAKLQDEPSFGSQEQLFRLIKHPAYTSRNWTPVADWDKGRIAVFDGWVDSKHCDIGENIHVHNLPPVSFSDGGVGECGEEETANRIQHHGTHVTALLGGSLNGLGIAGLIPSAQIDTWEIERFRLDTSDYREELAHLMFTAVLTVQPTVFNLSWAYTNLEGDRDPLENAVANLSKVLFVVAAGNESHHFSSGNCSLLPGCFGEFDNVLTVVGFDRTEQPPSMWQSSNSSRSFQVGAISEGVLSATRGNRHGRLSGTSQAVPQVTATAAYLAAIAGADSDTPLTPLEIKNRITYTADYNPALKDKVLGGRLNMARALDVGRVAVRKRTAQDGRSELIRGALLEVRTPGSAGSHTDTFFFHYRGERVPIRVKHLKRLIRNPTTGKYIVFYTPPGDKGKLFRSLGFASLMASAVVVIEADGRKQVVNFNDIDDFTAPLWEP